MKCLSKQSMKKIKNIIGCIVVVLVTSCAVSNEARAYKKNIDGNWVLQSITTEGVMGKINVQLFNEQDQNCFVGTRWNFNKSNSLGNYIIDKTDKGCTPIKRNFRWSIFEPKGEPKQFQFKRVNEKYKTTDNGEGFRFTMSQLDKSNMQLKSNITFENKTVWIVYNFVRP